MGGELLQECKEKKKREMEASDCEKRKGKTTLLVGLAHKCPFYSLTQMLALFLALILLICRFKFLIINEESTRSFAQK